MFELPTSQVQSYQMIHFNIILHIILTFYFCFCKGLENSDSSCGCSEGLNRILSDATSIKNNEASEQQCLSNQLSNIASTIDDKMVFVEGGVFFVGSDNWVIESVRRFAL